MLPFFLLAQLWMYHSSTQKLVNRNGNWKFETQEDYGNWTKGRMDVNNHSMLENKFGRFLDAKPVSAEEAGRSYQGKSFATYQFSLKGLKIYNLYPKGNSFYISAHLFF